jgi:hypothetical protein
LRLGPGESGGLIVRIVDSLRPAIDVGIRAVAALVPGLGMLLVLHAFASNAPLWDEWRWAELVAKLDAGTLGFADLWRQNYEHRIIIPSLIALMLARLNGWDVLREIYFSVFLVIVSQLILYRLVVTTLPARTIAPAFLAGSFLLFSLGQIDNWLWGFQLAWFVVNLCLLAVVLALSNERLGTERIVLGGAAAFVATFSLAFGLNVLVAGLFLLAARRPFPTRLVLGWFAFSCVLTALYFWHFNFHSPMTQYEGAGTNLFGRVSYFAAFLGAPIGGSLGDAWSSALGCVAASGIAFAVARFVTSYRQGSPRIYDRAPWLAIALYAVLGGLMLSAGRSGLGPYWTATNSRYVTLGSLVWIALVALVALEWPALQRRPQFVKVLGALGVLVAAASFGFCQVRVYSSLPADRDGLHAVSNTIRQYRNYSDAELEAQLFPVPIGLRFLREQDFPNPDRIRELIARLQSDGQGPFLGDN